MISHGKNIKIFSGNSHPALAMQIASALGLPIGKASISTFADGEISVSIYTYIYWLGRVPGAVTCGPVNNNLMELLIMIDSCKRASAGRITAVIPYFGYARQDRKSKARDPISAKLVADLITPQARTVCLPWTCTRRRFRAFSTSLWIICSARPCSSRILRANSASAPRTP